VLAAAVSMVIWIDWLTCVPSVFVNGRERPVIMQNMRERIERGDIEAEREEAIQVRALWDD
jgi:hypothetical protein